MNRLGLCLSPLDTLFFRDGRPFNAADQAVGGLPTPMPLAGAIRTAILAAHADFDFHVFGSHRRDVQNSFESALRAGGMNDDWYFNLHIRGPFLALQEKDSLPIPLLPVPNTLFRTVDKTGQGKWSNAKPLTSKLPGWKQPEGLENLLPLWRDNAGDEKHPGGYLTLDAIRLFLSGQTNKITDQEWFCDRDLFQYDARTGIEVDPDKLTAVDSRIYGIQLLTLMSKVHRDWCGPDSEHKQKEPRYHHSRVVLYSEVLHRGDVDSLENKLTGPLPLGGEGHYVNCQPTGVVDWPLPSSSSRRIWYLASPAIFSEPANATGDCAVRVPTWRPDAISPGELRAASTSNPLPVSGWDVARKAPRATRFAVPAGAVFYSENTLVPETQSLCCQPDDIREGWGFALTGEWT